MLNFITVSSQVVIFLSRVFPKRPNMDRYVLALYCQSSVMFQPYRNSIIN